MSINQNSEWHPSILLIQYTNSIHYTILQKEYEKIEKPYFFLNTNYIKLLNLNEQTNRYLLFRIEKIKILINITIHCII